jgi:glycosyltransferase involved in cell wall biosynthesis
VIVVDDGSTSAESRALEELVQRCPLDCQLVRLERNQGVSVARNVGIARASCRWIAFLDADDCWERTKLEAQFEFIHRNPQCRAIHTGVADHPLDGTTRVFRKKRITFEDLLEYPPPVCPSTLLVERSLLMECGLFDPRLRAAEDLDLFLRITRVTNIEAIADAQVIRRIQKGSLSRQLPLLWRGVDTTYRGVGGSLADPLQARRALLGANIVFVCQAIYARDWKLLRRMLSDMTRREIGLTQLLTGVMVSLCKARLAARRRKLK